MKKRACVMMIFLFCLALFGCTPVISSAVGSSSDSSSVSSSLATSLPGSETASSAAPSPSGAALTNERIDRIIAQLMKVDGTGEIWIGEGKAKLLEVLNKHGIPTQDAIGNILAGDTLFYFDDDLGPQFGIQRVSLQEIDTGLKCGDTVLKMKGIYGNNCIPNIDPRGQASFRYNLGNNIALLIAANGQSDDSVIYNIILSRL